MTKVSICAQYYTHNGPIATFFWQVYAVDVNPEDIAKADAIVIPTGDKLFKY